MLIVFLSCISIFIFSTLADDPIVGLEYGNVQGKSIILDDNTIIDSYLGIPFAEPPVGSLRFAPPEEPDPWDETFLATDLGNACIQESTRNALFLYHQDWTRFSEDCLNLNIFTPQNTSQSGLLPVMVWIHGGGFRTGSNINFPGYFVARKEVVLVVINYRVGIFGFSFTDDDAIPGNIGLLDQIFALQFVQENIAAFNGDPNQVTIFGESAGGGSVGCLLISPLAEGLFHGAILQSGNELAYWAVNKPETEPETYIEYVAQKFGCPVADTTEMVQCLRQIDAELLVDANHNCSLGRSCRGFRPVVDGTVVPDLPSNLRIRGQYHHVPELIGLNENENNIMLSILHPGIEEHGINRTMLDLHFWSRARYQSFSWTDPSRWEDVYEAYRFQYADWPYFDDPLSNRDMMARYETDANFGFSADDQAKHHCVNDTVYFYIYDYVPELSPLHPWIGAYHALENTFIFGWPFLDLDGNEMAYNHSQVDKSEAAQVNFTRNDLIYSDFIITLWTNFAKYGNPTPEPLLGPNNTVLTWTPYKSDELNYMNLKPTPVMKQNYRQKDYAFWTEYINYLSHGEEFNKDHKKGALPAIAYDMDDEYDDFDTYSNNYVLWNPI